MSTISSSLFDVNHLDALSNQTTCIHRLDPRVKLLATVVFIVSIMSLDRYQISALMPFAIYPIFLIALGNLPFKYLLRKVLLAAPFAFLIGIWNPFLDSNVSFHIGPVGISGGWLSFASIMIRFALTVFTVLALIATTGFNAVCMALERLGVPRGFVVQLLFLYRYIFVLTEEAGRMARARSLRSFDGKGMGIRVFGSMIGNLLLRTLDRAQRIHIAMLSRGFDGEIRLAYPLKVNRRDILFLSGWTALFILLRLFNLPYLLGDMFSGLAK